MEIINNGQITPRRLFTIVRLVDRHKDITRQEILDFVQPINLMGNQDASKEIYRAAKQIELIQIEDKTKVVVHPSVKDIFKLDTIDDFRIIMQDRILGITEPNQDNFLLNLVIAWYAVRNMDPIFWSKKDIENNINSDLFPSETDTSHEEGRRFNTTKLNAWLTWTTFLGFGWEHKNNLMPDAKNRILPVITKMDKKKYLFSEFIQNLSRRCKELDGGELYNYCWEMCKSIEDQGNKLSLMLSTGLRFLNEMNVVNLEIQPDATEIWHLFEADGFELTRISHIQING